MIAHLWTFLAFVAAGGGAIILCSSRLPERIRIIGSASVAGILIFVSFFFYMNVLSNPRPAVWNWTDPTHAGPGSVLAYSILENDIIYLWVRLDREVTPRYYSIPYSREKALELQQATREAMQMGTEVRLYGNDQEDSEFVFHPAPVSSEMIKPGGG